MVVSGVSGARKVVVMVGRYESDVRGGDVNSKMCFGDERNNTRGIISGVSDKCDRRQEILRGGEV